MPRTPEEYKTIRTNYDPLNTGKPVSYIFLCESPPASGGFFYDIDSIRYEFLFRAMMNLIAFTIKGRLTTDVKKNGLSEFQKCGCIIMDSVYIPVDNLNDNVADNLISENYRNLVQDINAHSSKSTKIIIVKSTLYELLYDRLIDDGYNVINGSVRVPFPSTGQQTRYHNAINLIKQQNNIISFCQKV